ncbi:hypothetical protein HY990_00080 [Candidatus Micrarchaeota archaeon]|nr:hypothetical protein [Candidatus Micrarchaeota archaeon]
MKKSALYLLFFVGILGGIISGIYFIVNVIEIPTQIKEIQYVKDSQGDQPKNVNSVNPSSTPLVYKFYNFFKLISIDLSAITSFLLLWFFSAIFLNTYKIIKGRLKKEQLIEKIDSLPMPVTYETTWIQLGFIGTLWGFMLVGWQMKETSMAKSSETIDILLKAFGTAILSTFAAVILAYVFAPLVKGVWRWINNLSLHTIIDEGVVSQLEAFYISMKNTTDAIGNLNNEIGLLKEKITTLSPDKVVNLLEKISDNIANFGPTILEIRTSIKNEISEIKATVKTEIENGIKPINSKVDGIDEKLNKFSEESGKQTESMKTVITDARQDMQKVLKDIEEKTKTDANQTESQVKKVRELIDTMENNLKAFINKQKIIEKLEQINELGANILRKINKTKPDSGKISSVTVNGSFWTNLSSWLRRKR